MLEELKTAEELYREGKLHKRLRRRIRIFKILSFLFGLITAYDILVEDFYWFQVFLVVAVSFIFGFLVLAKVHKVVWDKRQQIMMTQKMDIWGIVIVAVYVGARFASEHYLPEFFDGNVSKALAYLFFVAFGVTLGRFIGMLVAVYRAQPKSHQQGRFSRKKK